MERIYSIDLFKLIASFFVICMHTGTVSKIDNFEQGSFSFIIDNVARFAVPFFFVASGYLLNFNAGKKLYRRLGIIACIYLFWSVVFILIREVNGFSYPVFFTGPDGNPNLIPDIAYKIAFYGFERHLWFFPAYIIAAFPLIVLRKRPLLMGILAAGFYLLGLTGQLYSLLYPQPVQELLHSTHFTRSGLFLAFPCMSLGFFFKHIPKVRSFGNVMLPAGILVLFLLHYAETVFVANHYGGQSADYSFFTIFLAGGILLFCLNNPGLSNGIQQYHKLSGGVYLLHAVFIYFFLIIGDELFTKNWWIIVYTPLLFLLSLTSAYFMDKNRYLRKIIFS